MGTEAENWSLEAPLAELSEFMKRKKTPGRTAPKKIPIGQQCVTSADLFQSRVTVFME